MADFKISGKNVITQAGTDEPVLASNVTLGTGIVKPSNISDAASSTLSCTTDSTITVATADTSSLSVGMAVSGTNIPANAHIVTIPNSTSFTITSAATGGATSTLTFRTGITSAKIEDDAVTSAKVSGLVKGDVGLGNVDNTTDALKPVSTATTTALNLKADTTAVTHVKPHIQPGTLYPAVNGMIDYDSQYTFTDSSGTPKTITSVGHAHHIGNPKIGSTSIRLDANDYLTVPAHADFDFGTSDFCVEWWWKGNFAANGCWWTFGTGGNSWYCYQEAANKIRLTMGSTGTRQWDFPSATVWSGDGEWHHFAVTKTGTTAKLYIDGVEEDTINGSYTATPPADVDLSSFIMGIGAFHNGVQPLNVNSNIDEIRISNHIRYSANFTPSTTAFANDSNTKFLLHSDNGGNSGAYGTEQADGRKYYYTDIKGSKPIKDPRIGAHFGSQRHKFKSIQLLEQETAIHGSNVSSIDGREWCRFVDSGTNNFEITNGVHGVYFYAGGGTNPDFTSYIEFTGYFNAVNWSTVANSDAQVNLSIDGVTTADFTGGVATVANPLLSRYVDAGSVVPLVFSSTPTLGIHTVRIGTDAATKSLRAFGIELIAQDTTSTTTKSQIQIPSQNVVSYGKKFTVSGTPHYNPFAYAGDGTTAVAIGDTTSHGKVATGWAGSTSGHFDSTLDVATSLGLSAWVTGGNYYRPVNGGRIVRWVDSSGNIKTSVNMMPPTGTAYGAASDAALPTSHAWTTVYLPKLSSTTIDHSLAEVAKTFNFREFGNGCANAGTGNVTWADASMLASDVFPATGTSYVMDDGLTSQGGSTRMYGTAVNATAGGTSVSWTFIGTGISFKNWHSTAAYQKQIYVGQNLPYGTHIFRQERQTNNALTEHYLDGILLNSNGFDLGGSIPSIEEISYHQPKMPPIPEDAVVIADYMLMADFVPNTSFGFDKISKGVRFLSCSRDHFYESAATLTLYRESVLATGGFRIYNNAATKSNQLPFFGSGITQRYHSHSDRADNTSFQIDGSGYGSSHAAYVAGDRIGTTSPNTWDTSNNDGTFSQARTTNGVNAEEYTGVRNLTVGSHTFKAYDNNNGQYYIPTGSEIHSPIHTSSHYQTFETPFLHELVGGDRNMEQTNLVVTPDGQTWDQVTRDVSYIGDTVLQLSSDLGEVDTAVAVILDDTRGFQTDPGKAVNLGNKDFAIAYDRQICLKDGEYEFHYGTIIQQANSQQEIRFLVNGNVVSKGYTNDTLWSHAHISGIVHLKRGDYVQVIGGYWSNTDLGHTEYYIRRLA